jgi:hypothetical protein
MNWIYTKLCLHTSSVLRQKALLPMLLILMVMGTNMQSAFAFGGKDSAFKAANNGIPTITTLEACKLPGDMYSRIKHLSPDAILGFKEEFQATNITDEGVEIMSTVTLRFYNNHIIGYIKDALLNNSSQIIGKSMVDIPVEWMCIPPGPNHPFHFSNNIKELNAIAGVEGCKNWVQKDAEIQLTFFGEKGKKKKSSKK